MQSDRLANCTICGKLYLKDHTDYCLDCYKEMEREYKVISNFLKVEENRFASIEEVSAFTGVPEKRIAEFIRDGRIYVEDYPNLGYGCAHCGTLIKRQMLCASCFEDFTAEVNKTLKAEKFFEDANKPNEHAHTARYWKLKD
ncbi:flagellar protein [Planococcus sp. CAU13]|uniref:flagellar protein n=1 Tax=Planococcus sp. CAU13 TaxID=1541197 RepID=UPI000530070E|nr:flagellar protein [Planococcus sp. CAU13]